MAMARGRKGAGQAVGKAAGLIELKHRILQTLHKLSDRDTQQLAVEELERIAQNLTPEGIALFLACLYDTDAQQKSVVRRECIRLVGTLATLHGDVLACHLPKMVGNIIRRLKDPDSNIRDACVETIGILASQIGGVDSGSTTNVFVKPLLEALGEQHRNLQTGASMCLARVVECIKDPHLPTLQRLCPRVVKMLASPNFLAKASLLNAIGVMVQVQLFNYLRFSPHFHLRSATILLQEFRHFRVDCACVSRTLFNLDARFVAKHIVIGFLCDSV